MVVLTFTEFCLSLQLEPEGTNAFYAYMAFRFGSADVDQEESLDTWDGWYQEHLQERGFTDGNA